MTNRVEIQTGARLHFGLLAHRPKTGRHFGGAGLMIDSPGVRLVATTAARDDLVAPSLELTRVREIIAKYRRSVPPDKQPPPCRLEIRQVVSAHQGLGSGTQLALAIGQALAALAGEPELDVRELAQRVGRGTRSALGIHGFRQGGFLVDGGKRNLLEIGTLVSRVDFPSAWRIVLITPTDKAGLSGTDELAAFTQLPGMPEATTNRLCRLLLMELLPAVVEADFLAVCETIFEYGREVGRYFQPVQGGAFASRQMENLASVLREQGTFGVGQSSWGPTAFVLQESQATATALVRELSTDSRWHDCRFQVAAPLNHGAVLSG